MIALLIAALQLPSLPPPPIITVPVITTVPVIAPAPTISATLPPDELFDRPTPPRLRSPVTSLLTPMDYPAAARRDAVEGKVVVALAVSEIGRPTSCSIAESSKSLVLDMATCRLLASRARFEPARDRNGLPVTSAVRLPIAWRLPDAMRLPLGPWDAQVALTIGPKGELKSCAEAIHLIHRVPGPGCASLGMAGSANLLKLRGGSGSGDAAIRIDTRMMRGRDAGAAPAPAGKLLYRSVAKLTVDMNGRIESCRYRERHSFRPLTASDCAREFRGPYQTSGQPAGLTAQVTIVQED